MSVINPPPGEDSVFDGGRDPLAADDEDPGWARGRSAELEEPEESEESEETESSQEGSVQPRWWLRLLGGLISLVVTLLFLVPWDIIELISLNDSGESRTPAPGARPSPAGRLETSPQDAVAEALEGMPEIAAMLEDLGIDIEEVMRSGGLAGVDQESLLGALGIDSDRVPGDLFGDVDTATGDLLVDGVALRAALDSVRTAAGAAPIVGLVVYPDRATVDSIEGQDLLRRYEWTPSGVDAEPAVPASPDAEAAAFLLGDVALDTIPDLVASALSMLGREGRATQVIVDRFSLDDPVTIRVYVSSVDGAVCGFLRANADGDQEAAFF